LGIEWTWVAPFGNQNISHLKELLMEIIITIEGLFISRSEGNPIKG